MTAVLELDGLSVDLGGRQVLTSLTGALSGRAVGLLGPNGAGKTTLLNAVLGFVRPSAGTARVFGHDVRRESRAVRSLLGYMPENDAYLADATAVRFVRAMGELSGLPPDAALERAHEALFYVGLGEARYRPLGSYSLGMKQLAKLAQAIVHGPRLLLLDEPTNGLDPPARRRMLELVREIVASGVAVVISSHLLRDVEECCDQVLVLKQGRIAALADLAAERSSGRRLLELEVPEDRAAELAAAAAEAGCEVARPKPRRLKLVLPESLPLAELFRLAHERGVPLRRMGFQRDSLEELFLSAMESDGNGHGGNGNGSVAGGSDARL